MPARCCRLRCPYCLPFEARGVGLAIAFARPTHWLTVTRASEEWAETQQRWNRVTEMFRDLGRRAQFVVHVEANPNSTGAHIHGWAHGDPPSPGVLRELVVRAGMGPEVFTGEVTLPGEGRPLPLDYGMKAVRTPAPAGATAISPAAEEYLRLNGNRLVHATRGYWRAPDGTPLAGVRPARAAAKAFYGAPRYEMFLSAPPVLSVAT